MPEEQSEPRLKSLPPGEMSVALEMGQRCRDVGEPEEAESICLDVLEAEPENQEARILLLLARSDLLERGLPGAVDRALEPLERLASEFDRAYYAGIISERQARYLLRARGRHSSEVAWDWFRRAMRHFEEAMRLAPDRIEPVLRFNTCVRLVESDRHCMPGPDERQEHSIE